MRLSEIFGYALSNLGRHKLRTALTCAGVAVGVATLVVMVSLGSGLKRLASSQFDRAELITRITVMRGGSKRALESNMFRAGQSKATLGPAISDEAIEVLRKIPGVIAAYPDMTTPMVIEANSRITAAAAEALPLEALTASYEDALVAGRYWSSANPGDVCVLPSRALEDLGFARPEDALGTRVAVSHYNNLFRYEQRHETVPDPAAPDGEARVVRYVRPSGIEVRELDVVGIYDSSSFGYMGSYLHVPDGAGKALHEAFGFAGPLDEGEYRTAVVKIGDHRDLRRVVEDIEGRGFDTQTVMDVLKMITVVFAVFQALLAFFGGIGLFVAFFGIANTMVMAVLERTREIGVLKAIGARNRDVRRVFLAEASGIGLAGGAIGLGFGWFAGVVLNAIAGKLVGDPALLGAGVFFVEWWLAAGALGLATVIAGIAGLYPAWRAARMDPVEALRLE